MDLRQVLRTATWRDVELELDSPLGTAPEKGSSPSGCIWILFLWNITEICWFSDMGLPLVIIEIGFSMKSTIHPAIGVSPFLEIHI